MMAAPEIGAVQWLFGRPANSRTERLILVLEAFVDDSGNNADSPVFVLAGFVARAETWIAFEKEWKATLEKPPAVAYFKMKECSALRGQFNGWREPDRDARLLELVSIIKKTAIASVFSLVKRDDFKEVFGKLREPIGKAPYNLIYYSLMSATIRSMRANGIEEPVEFIFDEQPHLSDSVQGVWSTVLAGMDPSYRALIGGRPIHGDDKKYLPLQAADLLAWHIRRWYYADQRGETFESKALSLLRSIPYWGMSHDRTALQHLLDEAAFRRARNQMTSYLSSEEFREMVRRAIKSGRS
jgi:hypothetical protein